jgi:eukaryotic-like serine/threonine-protein kinase
MEISFRCPACRVKLGVDVEYAGRPMYCPKCDDKITIPKAGIGNWSTLGDFRLQKIIGEGSTGTVYLAIERSMEREVALKIFKPEMSKNPVLLEKFLTEVKTIARLNHPSIVTAYKAGEDSGYYYLAMNYISEGTLEDRVEKHGPMSEKDALTAALLISQALDYAWEKEKLLHLDIKPENLMLDQNGLVKITDLGIARCLKEFDYTDSQDVSGTPAFMSPEQAAGKQDLDLRSDIFSLGGTLYYLLTGKAPFGKASVADMLHRVINQEIVDPCSYKKDISKGTVAIIKKMMMKDRKKRIQSWKELSDLIREKINAGPDSRKLIIKRHPTEPAIRIKTDRHIR